MGKLQKKSRRLVARVGHLQEGRSRALLLQLHVNQDEREPSGRRRKEGEEQIGGSAEEALRVDEELVHMLTETLARCLEGQGLASQEEKSTSRETLTVAWRWLGPL